MSFARALRHLITPPWIARRRFPERTLDAIEAAIRACEVEHSAEVCFAVEAALDVGELWRGVTARERAIEAFAELRVWDTPANNGVLIFVLLADHDVEIVADRGAAAAIAPEAWEAACRATEEHFRAGRFEEGGVAGVRAVGALLAQHFPPAAADPNELRDRPTLR
ncbi:MAG TPA: TPM domain-containing protein [Myxococcota bacterium]|nr:TPM domain-containing protein [Myxococcota bacterium]